MTLGLTTASTLSGGAEAKTALSAIATLVTGAKTAADADLLHKQTTTALISQMNAMRKNINSDILSNLKDDDSKYNLREALRDIYAYKQAGTLVSAVVAIETQAQDADKTATTRLSQATKDFKNRATTGPTTVPSQ